MKTEYPVALMPHGKLGAGSERGRSSAVAERLGYAKTTFSTRKIPGFPFHRPRPLASIFFCRAVAFVLLPFVVTDISVLSVFAALFGVLNFAAFPVITNIAAMRYLSSASRSGCRSAAIPWEQGSCSGISDRETDFGGSRLPRSAGSLLCGAGKARRGGGARCSRDTRPISA